MAYNLPPPWDPGFAIPTNVRDEGLERHAYVTREMPRGTYDMPNVGTGGYAVPNYVMKEGYGQGTFTSKWLPPGSYTVPPIGHQLNQRPMVVADRHVGGGKQVLTIQRPYGKKTPGQAQTSGRVATGDAGSGSGSLVAIGVVALGAYVFFGGKRGRR